MIAGTLLAFLHPEAAAKASHPAVPGLIFPERALPPTPTILVTNTNDSGPGSLRQALADAHGGDTINLAVTGIITLTSGALTILNRDLSYEKAY